MRLAHKVITILLLCFIGAAVACDGGDEGGGNGESSETVSAGDYAADVCGAARSWVQSVQERAAAIQTDLTSGSSEGKNVLSDFLADVVADTDELLEGIDAAGVPDVEGGDEVAASLRSAFRQARDILADLQTRIEEVPEGNDQALLQAAQELGTSIGRAFEEVASSIQEPTSEELREALMEEEACTELTEGGDGAP